VRQLRRREVRGAYEPGAASSVCTSRRRSSGDARSRAHTSLALVRPPVRPGGSAVAPATRGPGRRRPCRFLPMRVHVALSSACASRRRRSLRPVARPGGGGRHRRIQAWMRRTRCWSSSLAALHLHGTCSRRSLPVRTCVAERKSPARPGVQEAVALRAVFGGNEGGGVRPMLDSGQVRGAGVFSGRVQPCPGAT
jgi:hypothetical protein